MKLQILIANDDLVTIQVLTSLLSRKVGIHLENIHHAYNGLEAYEYATSSCVDIILMDLNMPVMGGDEATQLIKDYFKSSINDLNQLILDDSDSSNEEESRKDIQAQTNGEPVKKKSPKAPYIVAITADELDGI
jgi:CheY-like chemotaxis protein